MTDKIYLKDSYIKEIEAKVAKVEGNIVYLDKTIFYALGGGQPWDLGTLECDGERYDVVSVRKNEKGHAHEVHKEGLKAGDKVTCKIDWDRRYRLMRTHTASHALSAIMHDKVGAKITGGKLGLEKSSVDFNLEEMDKELLKKSVEECNEKMAKGASVSISWMKREKALKDPTLVKLANVLPPAVETLRIVNIDGIDRQADGGTHVRDAKEVGSIEIIKFENKGKGRKRMYYKINP